MRKDIELWRNLEFLGFPNYEISNYGRVKSLNYGKKQIVKLLNPTKDDNGYLVVLLYNECGRKMYYVHRLVGLAFLPNNNNLPFINHKNEFERSFNFVYVDENGNVDESKSSIEWCSVLYNNTYGTRLQRVKEKMLNRADESKRVKYIDYFGNEHIFPSLSECDRFFKIPKGTTCQCLKKFNGYYKKLDLHFEYIEKESE